ncbi:44894_t:CDS:2, partial [Gigaspora margarita]
QDFKTRKSKGCFTIKQKKKIKKETDESRTILEYENDFEDIETEVLKWDQYNRIENYKSQNITYSKQKKKVRPSKVVQTTESKSDNNKEDGPSSYITEKKGKK